jgi:hypothetical protein
MTLFFIVANCLMALHATVINRPQWVLIHGGCAVLLAFAFWAGRND